MAAARPMTNATPEALPAPWRFSIALLRISCAGPGATSSTFSRSESVADSPMRPSTDTTTNSAGKMARTPK